MQGDSPSKASSPEPATSPNTNKPPSTRSGRGRPTSESIIIPWQVLKLAGSSASAVVGGSVDDQVKKPEEEESSRKMAIGHKRKHSQTTLPTDSPTKSHVHQQEAPHDDYSPASGGDDIIAVKNSCEEKAKMEAAFAVVSGKEKIEVEPASKAAKGKNIEEPCADADEDLVSSEAFAEEKYVDDDYESCDDDDAVTSKINKEMFFPVEEEIDDEEEKKEIVGENSGDEEKNKNKDETFEADNNKGEKDKKEAFATVAEEKKPEVTESSDAAEKRKMKFPFDLNELPSGADDEDESVMP
ncbi:hypothetical protein K1719_015970 [Acacia pycnantha]|nr:hypothetical protein K1719_015970 [Acacia pycnantha]